MPPRRSLLPASKRRTFGMVEAAAAASAAESTSKTDAVATEAATTPGVEWTLSLQDGDSSGGPSATASTTPSVPAFGAFGFGRVKGSDAAPAKTAAGSSSMSGGFEFGSGSFPFGGGVFGESKTAAKSFSSASASVISAPIAATASVVASTSTVSPGAAANTGDAPFEFNFGAGFGATSADGPAPADSLGSSTALNTESTAAAVMTATPVATAAAAAAPSATTTTTTTTTTEVVFYDFASPLPPASRDDPSAATYATTTNVQSALMLMDGARRARSLAFLKLIRRNSYSAHRKALKLAEECGYDLSTTALGLLTATNESFDDRSAWWVWLSARYPRFAVEEAAEEDAIVAAAASAAAAGADVAGDAEKKEDQPAPQPSQAEPTTEEQEEEQYPSLVRRLLHAFVETGVDINGWEGYMGQFPLLSALATNTMIADALLELSPDGVPEAENTAAAAATAARADSDAAMSAPAKQEADVSSQSRAAAAASAFSELLYGGSNSSAAATSPSGSASTAKLKEAASSAAGASSRVPSRRKQQVLNVDALGGPTGNAIAAAIHAFALDATDTAANGPVAPADDVGGYEARNAQRAARIIARASCMQPPPRPLNGDDRLPYFILALAFGDANACFALLERYREWDVLHARHPLSITAPTYLAKLIEWTLSSVHSPSTVLPGQLLADGVTPNPALPVMPWVWTLLPSNMSSPGHPTPHLTWATCEHLQRVMALCEERAFQYRVDVLALLSGSGGGLITAGGTGTTAATTAPPGAVTSAAAAPAPATAVESLLLLPRDCASLVFQFMTGVHPTTVTTAAHVANNAALRARISAITGELVLGKGSATDASGAGGDDGFATTTAAASSTPESRRAARLAIASRIRSSFDVKASREFARLIDQNTSESFALAEALILQRGMQLINPFYKCLPPLVSPAPKEYRLLLGRSGSSSGTDSGSGSSGSAAASAKTASGGTEPTAAGAPRTAASAAAAPATDIDASCTAWQRLLEGPHARTTGTAGSVDCMLGRMICIHVLRETGTFELGKRQTTTSAAESDAGTGTRRDDAGFRERAEIRHAQRMAAYELLHTPVPFTGRSPTLLLYMEEQCSEGPRAADQFALNEHGYPLLQPLMVSIRAHHWRMTGALLCVRFVSTHALWPAGSAAATPTQLALAKTKPKIHYAPEVAVLRRFSPSAPPASLSGRLAVRAGSYPPAPDFAADALREAIWFSNPLALPAGSLASRALLPTGAAAGPHWDRRSNDPDETDNRISWWTRTHARSGRAYISRDPTTESSFDFPDTSTFDFQDDVSGRATLLILAELHNAAPVSALTSVKWGDDAPVLSEIEGDLLQPFRVPRLAPQPPSSPQPQPKAISSDPARSGSRVLPPTVPAGWDDPPLIAMLHAGHRSAIDYVLAQRWRELEWTRTDAQGHTAPIVLEGLVVPVVQAKQQQQQQQQAPARGDAATAGSSVTLEADGTVAAAPPPPRVDGLAIPATGADLAAIGRLEEALRAGGAASTAAPAAQQQQMKIVQYPSYNRALIDDDAVASLRLHVGQARTRLAGFRRRLEPLLVEALRGIPMTRGIRGAAAALPLMTAVRGVSFELFTTDIVTALCALVLGYAIDP